MSSWIVLLEAAGSPTDGLIDVKDLEALVRHLNADAALHSPERYAVQLKVSGTRPIDAVDRGLSRWDDAVTALDLPRWKLVRAEVFTPEELERELEHRGTEGALTVLASGDGSGEAGASELAADELLQGIFRDPLTGLGSENAMRARLDQALARSHRTGKNPAVLWLDLDGFGEINRRLGHTAGDQVLLAVAQRLTAAVRPGDAVARLGGDDFGILLEEIPNHAAAAVSERIVHVLRSPLAVAGEEVAPVASVGVALGEPGQSSDGILRAVAAALSAAKASVGNRIEMFRGDTHSVTREPLYGYDGHDRLSYLLLMQRAAVAANEASTLQEAVQVILRQVCAHTGWPVGHLFVVSSERPQELISAGIWHVPANERYQAFQQRTEAASFAAGSGLPGRVLASGEPLWVSDLSVDREPERATAAAQEGLRAGVAFPILVADEVVAVLEFFSPEPRQPDGSLLEVLAGVGTQLGRVVERSRAHEALQESQTLLREAQALGRVGSWHTDLTAGRTTWSDELYELLGLDAATAPALEAFLAVVHPEDRGLVESDAHGVAVGQVRPPLEFRLIRPDGGVRWVVIRCSAVSDDAGNLVAFHATVQDISEHKRTAECSLSCELRWHLMLQGSQEILMLLNDDGAIRFCLAPLDMDALGSADGQPTMLVDTVHPDDVGVIGNVLGELLSDPESSVAFQVRFRNDVGEWCWFDSIASNLLDEPLIGAIVVNSLNVTEWKRLQERLAETTAQA